jgi:hypothetical protein
MVRPRLLKIACLAALAGAMSFRACPAQAQDTSVAVAIELNKLEAQGAQCRAYFVIDNKGTTNYDAFKLDVVLFRPDGVIGQRFAVDLAPLKASKRTVKLFDIASTSCDEVGSFLINDVMECKDQTGDVTDCLQKITLSSRTKNELTK